MQYKIHTITPAGCIVPISLDETQGTDYIEPGDIERARLVLQDEDFQRVQSIWTPDVLDAWQLEIQKMATNRNLDMRP